MLSILFSVDILKLLVSELVDLYFLVVTKTFTPSKIFGKDGIAYELVDVFSLLYFLVVKKTFTTSKIFGKDCVAYVLVYMVGNVSKERCSDTWLELLPRTALRTKNLP